VERKEESQGVNQLSWSEEQNSISARGNTRISRTSTGGKAAVKAHYLKDPIYYDVITVML
jgi:hypothetical protein